MADQAEAPRSSATTWSFGPPGREIGVRVALGAKPARIILAMFARPLRHVGLGIVAGAGLTAWIVLSSSGGGVSLRGTALVAAYAAFMTAVCLLACIAPTRRALGIQPTEALKEV